MYNVDVTGVSLSMQDMKNAMKTLKVNPNKITLIESDVTDKQKLDKIFKKEKPDTVVNCAWYQLNRQVMNAALKNGAHYVDLGGFFDITLLQLKEHKKWKDAGINATIGLGSTPGMTNVAGAAGAAKLDKVDTINLFCTWGNTLPVQEAAWPGYSIRTVMDEFIQEPVMWLNGKHKKQQPISGEKETLMPDPVGKIKTYYVKHSEPATMGTSLKAKNVTFRIGFPETDLRTFRTLLELGFADEKPMKVGNAKISPLDYITAMYTKATGKARAEKPPKERYEFDYLRADVIGKKDGLPATVTYFIETWNDPETGLSSPRDTAVPPSIVSKWQETGKIKKMGVFPPELSVDPVPFFKELGKRNIWVTEHFERTTKFY